MHQKGKTMTENDMIVINYFKKNNMYILLFERFFMTKILKHALA